MGNSFLRKYLENVSGIATGSDMPLELNIDMQLDFFKGEEICNASVWIRKSHDPMTSPNSVVHKANKIICCVRNPYDTVVSMFHFINTAFN